MPRESLSITDAGSGRLAHCVTLVVHGAGLNSPRSWASANKAVAVAIDASHRQRFITQPGLALQVTGGRVAQSLGELAVAEDERPRDAVLAGYRHVEGDAPDAVLARYTASLVDDPASIVDATATLLNDGKVLVAGGPSSQLYANAVGLTAMPGVTFLGSAINTANSFSFPGTFSSGTQRIGCAVKGANRASISVVNPTTDAGTS